MRLKVIDYDAVRKAFDEKFKETMQLIQNGETHLDNLAEGFHEADGVIWRMPTIDAVPVETVAQMFMDFTGDKCACNFNDTDGWLPFYCEHEANGKCPDPENVLDCWKQYIEHYEKRNEEDDGNG